MTWYRGLGAKGKRSKLQGALYMPPRGGAGMTRASPESSKEKEEERTSADAEVARVAVGLVWKVVEALGEQHAELESEPEGVEEDEGVLQRKSMSSSYPNSTPFPVSESDVLRLELLSLLRIP
jgi:hypothetical protein